MKNVYLLFVIIVLSGCKETTVSNMGIRECVIDVNKSQEKLDISNLFTDELEVVPLETTEECLISNMLKVQFAHDYIYVSDQVAQCVFQFSSSGKFVRSIGHRGESPIDYSSMGDFIVTDNYIYIQDLYKNKILCYDLNGIFIEAFSLGDIGIDEMINLGNNVLYCVSNYRNYKNGCFNLYKLDLLTRKMKGLIPADAKVAEKQSAWGLNRYSSKNGNSALIIYPLNDTIYSLANDSVTPQMIVRFSERSIPESMRYQNVMETMEQSSDYILGMDNIKNTDKYIFFEYGDGAMHKNAILHKERFSSETTDRFVLEKWGGLYISNFETQNNEFYLIQPASFFKKSWDAIYSKENFKNDDCRRLFEKLYNGLHDDDNPIIFKLHMS